MGVNPFEEEVISTMVHTSSQCGCVFWVPNASIRMMSGLHLVRDLSIHRWLPLLFHTHALGGLEGFICRVSSWQTWVSQTEILCLGVGDFSRAGVFFEVVLGAFEVAASGIELVLTFASLHQAACHFVIVTLLATISSVTIGGKYKFMSWSVSASYQIASFSSCWIKVSIIGTLNDRCWCLGSELIL